MRNIFRIITVLTVVAGVFTAPGCDGGNDADTLYLLEPYIQETEEGDTLAVANLHAHVFTDVEGTNWKVLSYEDAVAGIASDTIGGMGTITATINVHQGEDPTLAFGSFGEGRQIFVVVYDEVTGVYAWRQFKTVENAGTIYMALYLRPWKERVTAAAVYTETGWTMVNKIKEPDPEEPEEPEEPEQPGEPEEPEEPENPEAGQ